MRILIVDDGSAGEDLAHHLKTMYGAETFRALTLADGLAKRIEVKDLDFVVLDLSFPDSDRISTMNSISEMGAGVPVFIYTGYEEKDLLQQSLEKGATDWFLKGDTHRGGSALAARMASLYYRKRPDTTARSRALDSVFEARKEQASPPLPQTKWAWLTTAHTAATLIILLLLNMVGLGGYIWNQSASNALFRNTVANVVKDVEVLKVQSGRFHDENQISIQDRLQINRRLDEKDKDYNTLRAEMSAGFNRIYDVLLQDRQTKLKNGPN